MEVSVIQVLNFSHFLLCVACNKDSLTLKDDGIVINVEKSYEFKSQSTLAKLCFFFFSKDRGMFIFQDLQKAVNFLGSFKLPKLNLHFGLRQ